MGNNALQDLNLAGVHWELAENPIKPERITRYEESDS